MRKILIVATVQSHIAQFHSNIINELSNENYEIHIAANNNLNSKKGLRLPETIHKTFDLPFSRNPLSLKNLKALYQLNKIMNTQYDVIQCNTPIGGLLTRIAGIKYRKKGGKIIYTTHGFHFYKGAPLINWMLYFNLEKLFARLCDLIITINKEDYTIAKTFKKVKVDYVPGVGIDREKFLFSDENRTRIRNKHNLKSSDVLILSVGELNENKNFEVIIRALSMLQNENIYYFIKGNGPLKEKLQSVIHSLGLSNRVKLLGYGRDIELYNSACDLFILPSKREGLGLAAIEAMAASRPILTTNVHGINDYSKHGKTGFTYNHDDILGFANGIKLLSDSKVLREKMGKTNLEVSEKFDYKNITKKIIELYGSV